MSPARNLAMINPVPLVGWLLFSLCVLMTGCSDNQHDQQKTAVAPPPAAPARISAVAGDGEVFITWDAVPGATRYNLYVAAVATLSPQTIQTLPGGRKISDVTSPYSLDKLDNGHEYYFAVTAEYSGGEGTASPVISAMPTAPQHIPAAPQHLRVTLDGANAVLTWDPVDGARDYNLYLAQQPGVSPQAATHLAGFASLVGVATPYTFHDLDKHADYYFVITARNEAGESPPGNEVSIKRQAAPHKPAAPASLKAAAGDGAVTLTWSRVTGAKDYVLSIATRPGAEPITQIHVRTSPHRVDKLTNGTTYYFTVTARNGILSSAPSKEVAATPQRTTPPPSPPGKVTATSGDGQITLRWAAVANAQSYNLYVAAAPGVTPQSVSDLPGGKTVTAALSPHTLTQLDNGKTYYLVVTAVNAAGESHVSSEVSATPQAAPGTPPDNAPFLKLDASGRPLADQGGAYRQRRWNCVKSNSDGLVWEVKSPERGLHYRGNTYVWSRAAAAHAAASQGSCSGSACDTASYVHSVNAAGYCGFHDWRLPTREELHSLIDRDAVYPNPTINAVYFPNTVNSYYWTATPNAYDERLAWFVYFGSGYEYYDLKSTPFAVRLVRGSIRTP